MERVFKLQAAHMAAAESPQESDPNFRSRSNLPKHPDSDLCLPRLSLLFQRKGAEVAHYRLWRRVSNSRG